MTKRKTTQTPADTQEPDEEERVQICELEREILQKHNPELLARLEKPGKTDVVSMCQLAYWRAQWEQDIDAAACKAIDGPELSSEMLLMTEEESQKYLSEMVRQAKAVSAAINKLVAPGGKLPEEQGSLFGWCGYPTDMARVSPFFPIARDELKERPFLRDFIITAAAWGEIAYTGPKLSTYEDDALVVVLAALQRQGPHRKDANVEGKRTYTYHGAALPLLQKMGYARPSGKDYKRFIAALELMTVAGLKLKIAARTKTGKRKEPRFTSMSAILAHVAWDETAKVLTVTVNPFFYETYADDTVTWLDTERRLSLKGSIAKSLYRFVQSHRENPVFQGHYMTLAQVANMDLEQPAYEQRRLLKRAITELVKRGVLTDQSRFVSQDIVRLFSADESKKTARGKALPKGK